jgi:hypothetical protein
MRAVEAHQLQISWCSSSHAAVDGDTQAAGSDVTVTICAASRIELDDSAIASHFEPAQA